MNEISVLIGGKAGDGIRQAGNTIAMLLNRMGYAIFFYDDYPSLIRGGHNFSIIRASKKPVYAHNDKVDLIVALNQDAVENHKDRLTSGGLILYDEGNVDSDGVGLAFMDMVKQAKGSPIMRNTAAIGALAGLLSIERSILKSVIKDSINKKVEVNLAIANAAYDRIDTGRFPLRKLDNEPLPLVSGNEAIALGAVSAGMSMYIAYPMTPASAILHYLASHEDELNVVTVHPESEIAAALMAMGGAYAGAKTMVGTSGGGFALMTEALSLAGQAELPIVFVNSQRPGPSTGVPTYTSQGDLEFIIHSGHGEFLKLVVAPGDADEAFYLTAMAMNLAWKFQIPSFVLSDKHLSESIFSFNADPGRVEPESGFLFNNQGKYQRYKETQSGISPMAFPGNPQAVVKATSYEHDGYGIATEEADQIERMQKKRLRKKEALIQELAIYEQVKVYGNPKSKTVLTCWGSTKGACVEVAENLDIKVVQPLVLEPFPLKSLTRALSGASQMIDVEANTTGQLAQMLRNNGFPVGETILRFDGRPFTVDGLTDRIKEVLK